MWLREVKLRLDYIVQLIFIHQTNFNLMSTPLLPEQLSDLHPKQSIFELINGQEWVVESTDRNEHTRLARLRKKDDPEWGTHTVNERSANEFSLICPTDQEIETLQQATEEAAKWEGKYRKFWAPCDHGDTEKEAEALVAGKTIEGIIDAWQTKYMGIEARLLTDMWCGLYVDIWGASIYIEGDTPLVCFAMADKVLSENPPSKDMTNPFPPPAV
jgi:hypothetical protein